MTKEELQEQLEQLHDELRQTKAVDPEKRKLLRSLESDIQDLLNREANQPHHYTKLSDRFNEAVAELEASHPEVTLLMRRVIDSLAYLGI
jgi:predicted nuclease with TOPRIM domain